MAEQQRNRAVAAEKKAEDEAEKAETWKETVEELTNLLLPILTPEQIVLLVEGGLDPEEAKKLGWPSLGKSKKSKKVRKERGWGLHTEMGQESR